MRLIRTVLRPATFGLSRPFQRCQVIKNASSHLQPELIEISNLLHGSNIQCCGRSYAASDSCNTVEAKKARRRISQDERRSMVENYVNTYREMNAGKFPTVSNAQKGVGGSYYFVRQILQELMHSSKMSSIGTKDVSLEKSALSKDEISTNLAEISRTRKLGERISSKVEIRDSGSKSIESKQGPQSSITVEASIRDETQLFSAVSEKPKDVGTQSHCPVDEPKSSLPPEPENNIRQETIHEDKLKFDRLQPKSEPQESKEISGRELHKVPTEDAEPQRKSSLWKNLKSFAHDILGIWKRS